MTPPWSVENCLKRRKTRVFSPDENRAADRGFSGQAGGLGEPSPTPEERKIPEDRARFEHRAKQNTRVRAMRGRVMSEERTKNATPAA